MIVERNEMSVEIHELVDAAMAMDHSKRFANVAAARDAYVKLASMDSVVSTRLAEILNKDVGIVRGLRIHCGFALKAMNWLELHDREVTKASLEQLINDCSVGLDRFPIENLLAWELYHGAKEVHSWPAWENLIQPE